MSGQGVAIIAACLLAAVICGWLLPHTWRMPAVSLCGAAMLALLSATALLFVSVGTMASILVARSSRPHVLTPVFVATVAATYGAFLILNVWGGAFSVDQWAIPFAMAYSTLRLIHYVLESERGTFVPHRAMDVVAYQFFPASLAVGPINRFGHFRRDLRRRRWDSALFSEGLTRVLTGSAKVVILGNFLVAQVLGDRVAGMQGVSGAYLRQVQFWLSLYLQFSGYTDIAVGVGAMLGFRLPENFRYPFVARNIGDFWRRWHITLANWCRDYVYMPVLARSRSPRLAMTAAMLTIGLWHEASVHYVLWGLYHACGLNVWRAFQNKLEPVFRRQPLAIRRVWNVAAWVLTIHFVIFSYTVTTWIEQVVRG
jgi:alginate O-acetyltransferase complex protein AlgI